MGRKTNSSSRGSGGPKKKKAVQNQTGNISTSSREVTRVVATKEELLKQIKVNNGGHNFSNWVKRCEYSHFQTARGLVDKSEFLSGCYGGQLEGFDFEWVTTAVFVAHFDQVQRHNPSSRLTQSAYFRIYGVNSEIQALLLGVTPESWADSDTKVLVEGLKYGHPLDCHILFLPVLKNNHYVLYILTASKLYFHDSLGGNPCMHDVKNVQNGIGRYYEVFPSLIDSHVSSMIAMLGSKPQIIPCVPPQQDSWSCSYFVLRVIAAFLRCNGEIPFSADASHQLQHAEIDVYQIQSEVLAMRITGEILESWQMTDCAVRAVAMLHDLQCLLAVNIYSFRTDLLLRACEIGSTSETFAVLLLVSFINDDSLRASRVLMD